MSLASFLILPAFPEWHAMCLTLTCDPDRDVEHASGRNAEQEALRMLPFKVAAILALLLGGAGSACAALVTVVNPATVGGFETTAGQTLSNWTPSLGFNPAVFSINGADGMYYNPSHEGLVETNASASWQYIGLQNLSVQSGATITVTAYVWPNTINDKFGISYGTYNDVTVTLTPTQTYSFTLANINYGSYIPVTFTFTASSSNIDIDFGFLDAETVTPIEVDAISVTYNSSGDPVPEP
ncbi:MAG: hypothetical protein ABSC19_20310, partial [Syntrophorhabdales bacterium]